jgi:hypothetical protein
MNARRGGSIVATLKEWAVNSASLLVAGGVNLGLASLGVTRERRTDPAARFLAV